MASKAQKLVLLSELNLRKNIIFGNYNDIANGKIKKKKHGKKFETY